MSWTYPGTESCDTVIERKVNGGVWSVIASVEKGTTFYKDTGLLTNTIYYYRVRAVFSEYIRTDTYPSGENGQWCYSKLDAPIDLYGCAASNTQVYLMWTGNTKDAYYIIERKAGASGDFVYAGTAAPNTTMYLDSGLTPSTRYTYRIKAVYGTNYSDYSEEVTIACIYLEGPTNLAAVAVSPTEIKLSWNDNSSTESGFEIWRKAGEAADWEKHAAVLRNVTAFTDTELSPDTHYYYRIRAHRAYSDTYSAFTNTDEAWTISLKAPVNLQYTVLSPTSVSLTWKDSSSNEDGFAIERKEGIDGSWSEIAAVPAGSTGYTDSRLKAGNSYFYRIKVFDNTYYNTVSYSEELEVNTALPASPGKIILEPVSSTQIRVKWADNSTDETGFKIERRLYIGGRYVQIAQVGPDTTSFLDSGLRSKVKYYYRVRSFNKAGNSEYSGGLYAATKASVSYSDVLSSYWAHNEIENLGSRGIFKAKSGGSFNPEEKITRGEFIYMLVKAFNINMVPAGSFKDVKAQHTYYNEIMAASKAGIIPESTDSYFHPDSQITREDMAVFAARALKSIDKPLPAHDSSIMEGFSDRDRISKAALDSVCSLYGEGILEGKTINGVRYIAPKDKTTRAEAAVVVYRIIDR